MCSCNKTFIYCSLWPLSVRRAKKRTPDAVGSASRKASGTRRWSGNGEIRSHEWEHRNRKKSSTMDQILTSHWLYLPHTNGCTHTWTHTFTCTNWLGERDSWPSCSTCSMPISLALTDSHRLSHALGQKPTLDRATRWRGKRIKTMGSLHPWVQLQVWCVRSTFGVAGSVHENLQVGLIFTGWCCHGFLGQVSVGPGKRAAWN